MMGQLETLLARFEDAVSRHREANANFSRCSPCEIIGRNEELKAARKAITDFYEANQIRWMNIVANLKYGKKRG